MPVRKTLLTRNPYAAALCLLTEQGHHDLAGHVKVLYEKATAAAEGRPISLTRETLTTWRKAKRVIRDTPFLEKDEAEAVATWIFSLGVAVSSVSKAQENRRPVALRHNRRKAGDVIKAGGNQKARVRLPERDSALVQLLERVL